nr:hypothetical protein [Pandoravirus massiliensis]
MDSPSLADAAQAFMEPRPASDTSSDAWMREGDPQRVWIVSCPGASLPAARQRHVCLTPTAAARRAVRMALVARHRRAGRAVRGRSRLDDIDGLQDDQDASSRRTPHTQGNTAFDYAIDLDRVNLSAASLRWWSNSMAPGDVLDFCWYDEARAYDEAGRIECVTSFGDPAPLLTARSSQSHTVWSIVIYSLLATIGVLFLTSLLGGGRRRRGY